MVNAVVAFPVTVLTLIKEALVLVVFFVDYSEPQYRC
jgi:hypothetical protein